MAKIIGIAGGTASGKSTIAKEVLEACKNTGKVIIIKQDDYYKDQSSKSYEERIETNYDEPNAFDVELMVHQLDVLKKGGRIEKPIYDFTVHNRSKGIEVIEGYDVIILEGLFILTIPEVRDRCDLLVYVDVPADIRFIRRLKRDVAERGRDMDSVCNQYLSTVRPMHELHIEPYKQYADIIILNTTSHQQAANLLVMKVRSLIDK